MDLSSLKIFEGLVAERQRSHLYLFFFLVPKLQTIFLPQIHPLKHIVLLLLVTVQSLNQKSLKDERKGENLLNKLMIYYYKQKGFGDIENILVRGVGWEKISKHISSGNEMPGCTEQNWCVLQWQCHQYVIYLTVPQLSLKTIELVTM